MDQASILGFHIFDNAESYGSETFQREISEVLSLKRSVKVDTKIRVDFSQKQWLKLLEHDFEKIYKKYGEQLNAIFLHNPRGTLKQTLIALETILKFCEVTQSRSGISLQKNRYDDIREFPVDILQVDLNPTLCSHSDQLLSVAKPDMIEARSLFGSGLLMSGIGNFSQQDQRRRWGTPTRLSAGAIFRKSALEHLKSSENLALALIKFPTLWGIKNVVLGTTNIERLKLWHSASGKIETSEDIEMADALKQIGEGLYCF